jgi:hypothetical protein
MRHLFHPLYQLYLSNIPVDDFAFMVKESGRTTSALAEEDSSFYLWKWLIKRRRFGSKIMKRKKRKKKLRRLDWEEEGMFYPDYMVRKVNAAYFYVAPGTHPLRASSEIAHRLCKSYIFPGEKMQILRQLFPKKRYVRRKRRLYRKRFNIDWLGTIDPNNLSEKAFRPEILKSNHISAFDTEYERLGHIFDRTPFANVVKYSPDNILFTSSNQTYSDDHFSSLFSGATLSHLEQEQTFIGKNLTILDSILRISSSAHSNIYEEIFDRNTRLNMLLTNVPTTLSWFDGIQKVVLKDNLDLYERSIGSKHFIPLNEWEPLLSKTNPKKNVLDQISKTDFDLAYPYGKPPARPTTMHLSYRIAVNVWRALWPADYGGWPYQPGRIFEDFWCKNKILVWFKNYATPERIPFNPDTSFHREYTINTNIFYPIHSIYALFRDLSGTNIHRASITKKLRYKNGGAQDFENRPLLFLDPSFGVAHFVERPLGNFEAIELLTFFFIFLTSMLYIFSVLRLYTLVMVI